MEAGTEQKPPAKKRLARRRGGSGFLPESEKAGPMTRSRARCGFSEVRQRREIDETHAHPQLSRLAPALKVAGEAVARRHRDHAAGEGARPLRRGA